MDSSSVPNFLSKNSRKREFSEGSSADPDVIEIPAPPVNRSSKAKALKITEVPSQEIVDVDMYDDTLSLARSDIPSGVEAPIPWFQGTAPGILPNMEASHSLWSVDPQGIKSMLSLGRSDIPSGVEAPIPWFQGTAPGILPNMEASHSLWSVDPRGIKSMLSLGRSDFSSGVKARIPRFQGPDPSVMPKMEASHSLWSVDPRGIESKTSSIMESAIHAVKHTREEDIHSFWSSAMSATGNAQSMGSSAIKKNATNLWTPSGSSFKSQQNAATKLVNEDVVLMRFQEFKKFDIVQDVSDHHFVHDRNSKNQPSKRWSKKIQEEWKILEKDLPDAIFVRVYETRMDLLRAVIVGAEGTPYHDGLFFFDVFFPDDYPNVPPHVYYHSHGLNINPHVFVTGRLCLSLLNTWPGNEKEKWIPKLSTMLQVLVSIQGLILTVKPYFTEPAHSITSGTPQGEMNSRQYDENIFIQSLKTMVFTLRKQPMHFEDFVAGHFFKHARNILISCKAYMNGAQVGCLVQDGIQDVDEGDKSCTKSFRATLPSHVKKLVDAFIAIGVKGCEQFIPPAVVGTKTIDFFR